MSRTARRGVGAPDVMPPVTDSSRDTEAPLRRGRRSDPDIRRRILATAQRSFAYLGVERTSIRDVADDVGVDPALVHYYFGSKRQLLDTAADVAIDPVTVIATLRDLPVDELAQALPSTLLGLWDSEPGLAMTVAHRKALSADAEIDRVRRFLSGVLIDELATRVDDPPGTGTVRAQSVATELLGVATMRYVIRAQPLASLPVDDVVALIVPGLRRYLTGDIPT